MGQTKTIQVTVRVTPGANMGPYNNQAVAVGISPAGTAVSDLSDDGVEPRPEWQQQRQRAGRERPDAGELQREPAAIGIAKKVFSSTNNLDGTYTVVYDYVVKNVGSVTVNSVQVIDDLSATFPSPATP